MVSFPANLLFCLLFVVLVCQSAAAQTLETSRWPDADRRNGFVFCYDEMIENQGLDSTAAKVFCDCFVAEMELDFESYGALTKFAQSEPELYQKQFAAWWKACDKHPGASSREKQKNAIAPWTPKDKAAILKSFLQQLNAQTARDTVIARSLCNCYSAQIVLAFPNKFDYVNHLENEREAFAKKTKEIMAVCEVLLGPPQNAESWELSQGWSDYFRKGVIEECERALTVSSKAGPDEKQKVCGCVAAKMEKQLPSGIEAARQKREQSPQFGKLIQTTYQECLKLHDVELAPPGK